VEATVEAAPEGVAAVSATIEDVARRANVSVATVSRALRSLPNVAPATRDRVLAAAFELDYVADPHASRLAGGRTMTMGLVVPMLGSWYYATLFSAVERVAAEAGYEVRPFTMSGPGGVERFLLDLPFRKRVDALVVADSLHGPDELERVAEAGTPMLTLGAWTPFVSSLSVDNVGAARAAVGYLTDLGHRRVAIIGGADDDPFHFAAPIDRHRGYTDALRAVGVQPDPTLAVPGRFTLDGGAEAMQRLLRLSVPPTAVFACSDEMAIGAMQAARDAGLDVPHDLSVVGFDDHDVAAPLGLTTVRQDVDGLGERAARWLLDLLEDVGRPLEHAIHPTDLIVRRSTAPLHADAGSAGRTGGRHRTVRGRTPT
jgi:LacI family transcriptional regulator, repressor for deo operon, udp, cdd, tsx, nupC, and nupG